jgi:hypothetical protein
MGRSIISIEENTAIISVANSGPQGIQGATGPTGAVTNYIDPFLLAGL